MRRGVSQKILQGPWGWRSVPPHPVECLGDCLGGAIGKARDDAAASEHFWVGCEHGRRHGAPSGEARYEDALAVDAVSSDHGLDHLANGENFAGSSPRVIRLKPVETQVGVIRPLLFRIEHRESPLLGQLRPSRASVINRGILGTAMQHHDQRRASG